MDIKYKQNIEEAFKTVGFTPREGQVEGVDLILREFVDNKKIDVVLVAPTGSGKSIVGLVVAEALASILGDKSILRSCVGMHQNVLVDQYGSTFEDHRDIMQIKGTSNYRCGVMNDTAENCVSSSLHTMNDAAALKKKHCDSCEFYKLKKRRNSIGHLVTNYSFMFVDRLYANILDPRLIYVWDEAHLLNDVFTEHNAIYVSMSRLKYFLSDINGQNIPGIEATVRMLSVQLNENKVNESNYMSFITSLRDAYGATKEYFESRMATALYSKDFDRFKSYGKLYKKYGNMACKISDLLTYNYSHVFDSNVSEKEFTVKSLFIGSMFDVIRNSKYNLFMSATLSEDYIETTMNLDPKTTAFIRLPSLFPKENKKVLFVEPLMNLNYESMQKPATIKAIQTAVIKIAKHHADLNESGIVLVPTFKLAEAVADALRKSGVKLKIFEHVRGTKVGDEIARFKKYKGAAVLVSPSLFEGVDLPDDLSRFQIVTKVPWPSLADKRMKIISNNHGKIYRAITLHKLIQGLGRSVRSPTDHATSYILDKHGYDLMVSSSNAWIDEFDAFTVKL